MWFLGGERVCYLSGDFTSIYLILSSNTNLLTEDTNGKSFHSKLWTEAHKLIFQRFFLSLRWLWEQLRKKMATRTGKKEERDKRGEREMGKRRSGEAYFMNLVSVFNQRFAYWFFLSWGITTFRDEHVTKCYKIMKIRPEQLIRSDEVCSRKNPSVPVSTPAADISLHWYLMK